MVYTAEPLPLVAGPLVAFYWPWPRWCLAAWEPAYERWKLNIIKSCLASYTDPGTGGQQTWPVTMDSYKHCSAVSLGERELQVQSFFNGKYEPWYKTPASRVTFNLSICLGFDCILWVWVSVLGFDATRDPLESWLSSVTRDQDGIKRRIINTTHSEIISDCFSQLSPAQGRLLSPAQTQWDVNIGPNDLKL